MPNATVRANARSLPEATNRRAVLGAVLAAGATAALPAAALSVPPALSPADQRVLDLWRRRGRLKAALDRLDLQIAAAKARMPKWAQPGPKHAFWPGDATPVVDMSEVSWPEIADLEQQLRSRPFVMARPGPTDLLARFDQDQRSFSPDTARRNLTQALVALDRRLEEQKAEMERAALPRLSTMVSKGVRLQVNIENELEDLQQTSVLGLAATLLFKIQNGESEDHEERSHRATLAILRPQLVGPIAEAADGLLAEHGEAA
jgi:hypothetical protein